MVLSCPGALLRLNYLTILLNSSTVSGYNEMDSERERRKKSLGDEFVGEILLEKFNMPFIYISPDVGKVITELISNVNRITDFHSVFGAACRIWCFSNLPVDNFIKNFPTLL